MIAALTNHLWQSTLFVLAAGVVAAALRKNGAHVRHRVWLIASLKFFVPFSLLMSLGASLPTFTTTTAPVEAASVPALSIAVEQIAQPFTEEVFSSPSPDAPAAATNWTAVTLGSVWAIGVLVLVAMRVRGWRRIRAALRASAPFAMAPLSRIRRADRSSVRGEADLEPGPPYVRITVRSTPGLLEPGVVGLWRPVLLVPAGIEQHLTPRQLDAVLAHELCHVRRHDNLTSAIHMVVEAVFWFHPLVWFVGARLVEERERACDEHVLRVCSEPQTYAESILNVCKCYVESPLTCVSGVTGSDLKRRIAAIVGNRVGRQLTLTRRIALTTIAVLAVVLPLAAGMIGAPIRPSVFAQAPAAQTEGPRFEVVSIKPCEPGPNRTPVARVAPTSGFRGAGAATAQTSPGSVYWDCVTLAEMIEQAYVDSAHPLLNSLRQPPRSLQPKRIRGGPAWVETDRFTVDAKGPLEITSDALAGATGRYVYALSPAMSHALRAALEDRFQLTLHRATEQQDMYALSVAKGGVKKDRLVTPTPGDCQTIAEYGAASAAGRIADDRADPKICGRIFSSLRGQFYWSMTMSDLASDLSVRLDHFVLDRTGLNGPFNFALALESDAGRGDWTSNVGALGLTLAATKGPAEYLLIDQAQRPRPNDALDAADPPARALGSGRLIAISATQTATTHAAPAYDVVSVKPCEPNARGQSRGGGGIPITSPGRLYLQCYPLSTMVGEAYVFFADGRAHSLTANLDLRVEGETDWMKTERYTIDARTGQVAPAAVMRGPMLQAVLEDRFKLKIRRVTRETPIYELVIAKSGAKVAPYLGHDCVIKDVAAWPPIALPAGQRYCGDRSRLEGDQFIREGVLTLDELAGLLDLDRPLVNRTGIAAPVSYRFEYSVSLQTAGAAGEQQAATIAALKNQLGLDVRASKGPRDFLVVDHAERPAPNDPAFVHAPADEPASAATPSRATGAGR